MSWALAYTLAEWSIRLGIIPVVIRRHNASAALSWLALVFLLPAFGLLAYTLFGDARLPRRRIKLRRARKEALVPAERIRQLAAHVVRPPAPLDLPGLGDRPAVGGNRLELLDQTVIAVDRIVAAIDAAEHHAHLLFYIYADDDTGRRVADALCRAAQRGVRCRVLADATGSFWMLRRLAPKLREQGVEVHEALPVGLVRAFLARIDLRNHRKLVVIDGQVAFTGSQNIVDPDYGRKGFQWRDVLVRIEGPAVLHLQEVFCQDWYFETGERLSDPRVMPMPRIAGDVPVKTVPSGPIYPTEAFVHLLVAAIHAAREQIVITSPYFIPDEPLLLALRMAAVRGVRVDLVMPERADHLIVSAAGRAYYDEMLAVGARIHLHRVGLLHTKSLTIDDTLAVIGSGNFDIRSFYLNFELNLLLWGEEVTRQVRALQWKYMKESEQLNADDWLARPAWRWFPEHAAKLLSPLL